MTEKQLQRKLVGWWLLVGSIAVLTFGGRAASDSEPATDSFYRYDTALFGFLLYAVLLVFLLLIAAGLDLREAFGLRRPESWRRALAVVGGAFVAVWIAAVILEQIFRAGEEQGLDPEQLTTSRIPPFLVNVLLAAVVVPIVEELIYRGLGFRLLLQFGELAAIAIPSFAFALAHGFVEGLPVFFVIGAALAYVRARTGSIYPAILMHGAFNGIQLVLGAAT